MKFAVIRFPGSNCDQDCFQALSESMNADVEYVWHKEHSVDGFDAIVLPGGFSYGDYLRCGAIARFSPVMSAVKEAASAGKLVIGICNGFQILCESGLLPGALVRNQGLHFVCADTTIRVETAHSPFTNALTAGAVLKIPVAHGEGCYTADAETLESLNKNDQVLVRYSDPNGLTTPEANPNGSLENIAGIVNRERNVFGLMPHPDRAADKRTGSEDGKLIFESMLNWLK
ncbi:MAG TPA: phosphoribosylformylglycinamidine synthase subunit PurQ [Chthoniobacterales bacterium]